LITVQVKQSLFINLSAEKIFTYLSTLENLMDWSSVVSMVKNKSSEVLQVGTTLQSTIRFLGNWYDITFEVIEHEPCYSLTIKSIAGIAPCLFWYYLEPASGGGTTISQEAVVDLIEDFSEQAEQLITSALRRQLEHDLLTLKDILEVREALAANKEAHRML
jgi:Polyketide cyclase / dehydrase and lipid transport